MADGVTGETGDSVAPHVELDSKSTLVPVLIRLHLMVAHNVQETIKRQNHVITAHAQLTGAGATLETGESVAPPVETASKSAHAPVPAPLHLMVERNAQETTKKKGHVIMVHALLMEDGATLENGPSAA